MKSATIMPELRKAWSGEMLGGTYVDRTKKTKVEEGQYRCSLWVGVQPLKAGGLLNDVDGGTPHRFLWLPVAQPFDAAPTRAEIGQLKVWRPHAENDMQHRIEIGVCEQAHEEIREHRRALVSGEIEGDDQAHIMLLRLKAAAALAIVLEHTDDDGIPYIDEEAWELAAMVIEVSESTRLQVLRENSNAEQESNRARGRAEGERAVIVEEITRTKSVERVSRTIVRKLAEQGPTPRSDLRRPSTPGTVSISMARSTWQSSVRKSRRKAASMQPDRNFQGWTSGVDMSTPARRKEKRRVNNGNTACMHRPVPRLLGDARRPDLSWAAMPVRHVPTNTP
jgi:hypothetical protein